VEAEALAYQRLVSTISAMLESLTTSLVVNKPKKTSPHQQHDAFGLPLTLIITINPAQLRALIDPKIALLLLNLLMKRVRSMSLKHRIMTLCAFSEPMVSIGNKLLVAILDESGLLVR